MTVNELIDELKKYDGNANIITFNRTSNRWFKTGDKQNYPVESVEILSGKCGDYAKKQLSNFKSNDVAFFF